MMRRLTGICCLQLLLAGCAGPDIRLDREAERLNLTRVLVKGTDYQHVVYRHLPRIQSRELHVYLDGDGTPWLHHRLISANPTPRNPLVLRLMALDPNASVYLGRPCYHGFSTMPPCTPALWTQNRYSTTVIDTMTAALRELRNALQPDTTVLIGFSGGGALAMLLAERLDRVAGIVTIAGNLDHAAWTARHRYSPLTGSENPARHPPLSDKIFQLHLAGAKDTNIPADLIRTAAQRQPAATFIVLPDGDHDCCWEQHWPSILKLVDSHTP